MIHMVCTYSILVASIPNIYPNDLKFINIGHQKQANLIFVSKV